MKCASELLPCLLGRRADRLQSSHAFFLAKLEIRQAWLINMYGGPAVVSPKDYYAADAPLPAKAAAATGRAEATATA